MVRSVNVSPHHLSNSTLEIKQAFHGRESGGRSNILGLFSDTKMPVALLSPRFLHPPLTALNTKEMMEQITSNRKAPSHAEKDSYKHPGTEISQEIGIAQELQKLAEAERAIASKDAEIAKLTKKINKQNKRIETLRTLLGAHMTVTKTATK